MKKEEKENDQDLTEDVMVFGGEKSSETRLRYRKIRYGVLKGIQRQGFVLWQYGTHMHCVLCGIVV